MKVKGFTLIELLMIVVIIGILVLIAIPTYFSSAEKAKGAAARSVLDNLRKAELQYRAINDIFVDDSGAFSNLEAFDIPAILVNNSGDDGDWQYDCSGAGVDSVLCTATRNGTAPTAYQGQTITMDQDGNLAYSHAVYQ